MWILETPGGQSLQVLKVQQRHAIHCLVFYDPKFQKKFQKVDSQALTML